MRVTGASVSGPDQVLEFRIAVRNRVIRSHVNYSLLQRVQVARAKLDNTRLDALRLGLFEISLAPDSVDSRRSVDRTSTLQNSHHSADASGLHQPLGTLATERVR